MTRKIFGRIIGAMTALSLLAGTSHVEKKPSDPLAASLFSALNVPTTGKPRVYGFYSKGCMDGAVQLPETGPTWQAMRLSRNRHWGHPDLVEFIKDLSVEATKLGWAGLYIGDMSQPRGGPMNSSHASHQNGLDVDIWYTAPKRVDLSRTRRENVSAIIVRTNDQKNVNSNWTPAHMALLKAAAEDTRVDRIFVAAAIKIDMCAKAGKDRKWLTKIRPLYGHHDHFHVRLKCPRGNRNCDKQTPAVEAISKGDGCDETLTWWVTDYLAPPPKKKTETTTKKKPTKAKPRPRRAREMIMADLPRQCVKVLNGE